MAATIAGLVASPLVVCASELMASADKQMACCQSGRHDCGATMKAADCCTQSGSRPQQLGVSKVESVQKISVPALLAFHPAWKSEPARSGVVHVYSTSVAPADTGPPDCISFSALLI
ncbi:MAG TPA: hypothetical protein VJN96_09275 [Vicinamibacterales bacterium]|nr:hypothetical protein [Vicinamibacterales bacterium]